MVKDQQMRMLMKLMQTEKTLSLAAAKAGMDEKTARKYRRMRKLPSEVKVEHTWQTREDPFAEIGKGSARSWRSIRGWKPRPYSKIFSADNPAASPMVSSGHSSGG